MLPMYQSEAMWLDIHSAWLRYCRTSYPFVIKVAAGKINAITGSFPPTPPPTSTEYTNAGLPWFDYYSEDTTALAGSKKLADLDSIATLGKKKGDVPLPENESVTPERIVELRKGLRSGQVREAKL